MLTVLGPRHTYCDGISRRNFLKVGALGVGGLTLPGLMRAEAAAGTKSHKSVIMVYLTGGLAHQDTFDLKPTAPAEVRGEFKPIPTNLPGVQFSEHLPKLARIADKLVVVRSLVGQRDEHSSWQSYTGVTMDVAKREKRPHFGSVVARMQGQTNPVMPAFVDLSPTMQHKPYNSPGAAMLGRAAAAVKVDGDEVAVMKNLSVPMDQLADRRSLLSDLDSYRKASGGSTDTFHERAFDVLTTSRMVEALDVTKEPERTRDRYGRGSSRHQGDGGPQWNDQLLMARRLVEAGARVVTLAYGFWDTHGQNFRSLKRQLPLFDTGISALVEDIHNRGLQDDVTVVVWGEFGRTPKINKDVGRDHWGPAASLLFAGAGVREGQVLGATDKQGAYVTRRPVAPADVACTVFEALGIDPRKQLLAPDGRPVEILDKGETVKELFA
jgi:hypothetical protein